ncbi:hypothetical protein ACFL35_09005 [Candidatus Riflebacteria bacterium]
MSKSGAGFHKFHLELYGHEGLLLFLLILTAPIITLFIVNKLLPAWGEDELITELKTVTGV